MRNFLSTHWKTLLALLILVFVALLTLSPSAASPDMAAQLRRHVEAIATVEHNTATPAEPARAARYIETTLGHDGYAVRRQEYKTGGAAVRSIEVSLANVAPGERPQRMFIVGASHNSSGTAAVLELARLMRSVAPSPGTELKFVFFVNDAPRATTGARHAQAPARAPGNFIAFAGTRAASARVAQALAAFQADPDFPAHGLAAHAYLQGVTLSGPTSHDRFGYPALMITHTSLLRYPYYHTAGDTPDELDYERLARVVSGLARTIGSLAGTTGI